MGFSTKISAAGLAVLLMTAGCGDDGGTDAGFDSGGGDGGSDAGVDAATDGGGDAGEEDAGPPPEPDWSCLGSVTVVPPTNANATLNITLQDSATMAGVADATIMACDWTDTGCAMPVDTQTSDAMGMFTSTVPLGMNGFWGFAKIAATGYPDHTVFGSVPITEDVDMASWLMITTGAVDLLGLAAGVTQDYDTNGAVAVAVFDCAGELASGVALTASAGTPFYVTPELTPDTMGTETSTAGAYGVFNAPPGMITITAVRASDSTPIATAEAIVEAGGHSAIILDPTPDGAVYTP